MKHSTYIFDFDGTLVDSMPSYAAGMRAVLDAYGTKYPPDVIKTITPLGYSGTAKYFQEKLGVRWSEEEIISRATAVALPKYQNEVILKEGVAEYLQRLKAEGCSLNVLTASPHMMVDCCLERNGVYGLFDNVWSCDDFGLTKSDVRIYSEAVARVGSQIEDTAFFDDNIHAIRTAARAGLYTVGVYDASAESFAEELRETADRYVMSFLEL